MDTVRYPPERVKFIIEDTSMTLLVTVKAHAARVVELGTLLEYVVCVDALLEVVG